MGDIKTLPSGVVLALVSVKLVQKCVVHIIILILLLCYYYTDGLTASRGTKQQELQ